MTEYFTKDSDGNYVEVSEKVLPQSDVDGIIEKRLERERGKYSDYDDLKAKAGKVDTVTKEYEDKLKAIGTEKSDLETKLSKATLETDKVKLIHEFKLSDDLAEFVTGDTVDEMRQRAEKLSKGVTGGKVTVTKTPKPGEKASDSKTLAKSLFPKKSD